MKYEGVGFNEKWVRKFTQYEFMNHSSNQHLWPKLSKTARKDRLREIYKLIKNEDSTKLSGSGAED